MCSSKRNNLKVAASAIEEVKQILDLSNNNKRQNMAKMFANRMMKSNYNQLNTKLMMDFNKLLSGNAIYIPHFLCKPKDFRLLKHIKTEIELSDQTFSDWSKHQKFENPNFSKTFNLIIEYISSYFMMEVYASRLNYYGSGMHWKPYHHDSHAYLKNKNAKEDFVSFKVK